MDLDRAFHTPWASDNEEDVTELVIILERLALIQKQLSILYLSIDDFRKKPGMENGNKVRKKPIG